MGLIRSTENLRDFLPVTAAFDLEDLKPFMENTAEPDFLIPALSQTQYDQLKTKYEANELSLSADEQQLLKLAMSAVANYALMLYLDWAQLNVSQDGIHITINESRRTPFPEQMKAVKTQCSINAFRALERLLVFLELKKTTFTLWAASSSATIFKECFINTAEDFSNSVNINNSRRTFLALKSIMKDIEEHQLVNVLTQDLYDEIKAEIVAGNLSANNLKLMKFIKPAVANLTMAESVHELPLQFSEMGIVLSSISSTQSHEVKTPAPDDRLSAYKEKKRERGERELKLLNDYLQAKASDTVYPLFYASENYVGPPTETGTSMINPTRADGSTGGIAGV